MEGIFYPPHTRFELWERNVSWNVWKLIYRPYPCKDAHRRVGQHHPESRVVSPRETCPTRPTRRTADHSPDQPSREHVLPETKSTTETMNTVAYYIYVINLYSRRSADVSRSEQPNDRLRIRSDRVRETTDVNYQRHQPINPNRQTARRNADDQDRSRTSYRPHLSTASLRHYLPTTEKNPASTLPGDNHWT